MTDVSASEACVSDALAAWSDAVDALQRAWTDVDATKLWVDVAYRLLLGRPAEPDALFGAWRALAVGHGSRRAMVRDMVASREFAEALLIEEALIAVGEGRPWQAVVSGRDEMTERVVEVPWVLSRYRGERRVLDVGSRHAPDAYVTGLLRATGGIGVIGLDLVMRPMRGFLGLTGDVCDLPIATGSVDFASCISTLEHIGCDNSGYGAPETSGTPEGALRELGRTLAPGGRLAVTVPFGRAEDHGWFRQYDEPAWRDLVNRTELKLLEEEVFVVAGHGGWTQAEPVAAAGARYGDGVPAARAVLCALLARC